MLLVSTCRDIHSLLLFLVHKSDGDITCISCVRTRGGNEHPTKPQDMRGFADNPKLIKRLKISDGRVNKNISRVSLAVAG